jgi:hypothetical protein
MKELDKVTLDPDNVTDKRFEEMLKAVAEGLAAAVVKYEQFVEHCASTEFTVTIVCV